MDVGDAHDRQPSCGLVFKDDLLHGCDVLLLGVELEDSNRRSGKAELEADVVGDLDVGTRSQVDDGRSEKKSLEWHDKLFFLFKQQVFRNINQVGVKIIVFSYQKSKHPDNEKIALNVSKIITHQTAAT